MERIEGRHLSSVLLKNDMGMADQNIPWFNGWAWRLYEHLPVGVDDALKKSVQWLLILAALRVPVAILRGPTRHSERSGTVVVAGDRPWADYLPRHFFACAPQREVVGTLPVWALPSLLKRLAGSADLIVARVDCVSARLFFENDYLVVPESVSSRLILPVDLDKLAHASSSVKEDLRTLRRERLTAEVSHREADCEAFHSSMYVPFVKKRHGEFAVIHNLHQLRRAFRRGGLIWVRRGDQRIAGGLFEQRGDVLRLVALGTAGGDLTLMKQGALAALYIFEIKCAEERRCASIDFGGTPPILNDGLLRFKRKWGVQFADEPQTPYDYLVRWKQPNEQVLNFLADTPLIFKNRGHLAGLTALRPNGVAPANQAPSAHRSLWMPGLRRLVVAVPTGYESQRVSALHEAERGETGHGGETVFCHCEQILPIYGGIRRRHQSDTNNSPLAPAKEMTTIVEKEARYWNAVATTWDAIRPQALWRAHSDAVNLSLLARWLPKERVRRLLKTDVFDEAFGDGLLPLLLSKTDCLVCMDVSISTIGLARKQYAKLRAVGADVRSLPFKGDTFDIVVSNSTLDHFTSRGDILISLRELSAALKPGGQLLLTLDNLANPTIALRNVLPFRFLHRLGVLPYFVGATLGPRSVQHLLRQVGLEVAEISALMHCPRVLAVLIARLLERRAMPAVQRGFLRWAMAFERLAHWPTRFLTGNFVAVRAVKSSDTAAMTPLLCERQSNVRCERNDEGQMVYTVAHGSDVIGYVVIDSTLRGSSRGGLRMHPDVSEAEIRRLARTMTLKCGFLGQPQGGAKAGLRFDPEAPLAERRRCLAAFGKAIAPMLLNRTFIPGPDMGTTHADIQYLLQIVGAPVKRRDLVDAQTGYYTSVSVFAGVEQATRFLGIELAECRVAIEGFGKVGMELANLLDEAQAHVVAVSTARGAIFNPKGLDVKRLSQLAAEVGSRVVDLYADAERISCDALLELPVDVLCPCAGSHSLHMDNASRVAARIVCGGANNPITTDAERLLFERGALCLPDFVTNSGGVLGGAMEFASIGREEIVSLIEQRLGARIAWLLSEAARHQELPYDIAVPIARQRFEEMRRAAANPTLLSRLYGFGTELYSRGWIPGPLVATLSRPYFERRLA